MTLDYSTPGEVKISMIPYISETLVNFPEEITGSTTMSAADHLFEITH